MRYIYLWVLTCLLSLSSCFDDKGNYDYHEINQVEIAGLEESAWYSKIAFVDTLRISPEVTSNWYQDNLDNYRFEWKFISTLANEVTDGDTIDYVVSREKDLVLPITQEAGTYNCFFVVRDTVNGLDWRRHFNLRVSSLTSEGWMVLCDDHGEGRLDMVFNENETNDLIAYDLWRDNDFTSGKPYRLMYNYTVMEQAILYTCEKGTFNLDSKDLHVGEDNDFRWRFGSHGEQVDIRGSGMAQFCMEANPWVIVDEKGDAYIIDIYENGSVFGFPKNRIGGKDYFKAAPFVGITYAWYYGSSVLMYDETHRQFLELVDGATFPSVMKFTGQQLFPVRTGRDIVHLESTKGGFNYAILKDPVDGKYYFYCIEMNEWGKNYQKYYGEISGDGLEQVKMFACHHMATMPYLFYATDHKIYQFDMAHPENRAKEVLDFPDETIAVIKFTPFVAWEPYESWERIRNYQLVVGTNKVGEEAGCGVMRMYDIPNLMGDLVKVKEHTGFGKIVDITYKERSQR